MSLSILHFVCNKNFSLDGVAISVVSLLSPLNTILTIQGVLWFLVNFTIDFSFSVNDEKSRILEVNIQLTVY